ncbi:MAG TPA: OmpA family protein [Polyangia bacterium]|jgi:outer membrane protein OmpA-like peptidoglycan-associated protein
MRRTAPLGALLLLVAGCPGNDLRGRTNGIRDVIRQARENGAYKCAPRELAMAESHLEFATTELDDGKYFPAKREVAVSEDNAHRALELSPKERCNPPPVPKVIDTDGDGIPDKLDKCPTEPEDKDGFQDADGCPDPDNDNDGILDKDDKCPNEPEDKDGFEDEDGCPDPDNDKDGVLDADDKCPNDPGPKENGGCPDKDRDGDGVVDRLDKCPDQPGPADNDGCPKPKFIVVTKEKIELKQKVHFATNKSTIYPDSFPMLTEVAEVLKSRPEIKVRIEGHTDSRGTLKHNMKLSQDRAESVRTFLVDHGVGIERMEARGFGPTQPIDDNRTSKGRENNRRTEFIITSQ